MSTDSLAATPYITAQGRDLRLDLLRGYFVFAMVVDHVRGASPLWLLTGGNRFFAGAAEGFILTSGLVAGLVYGRLVQRDGMGRSFLKVLSRAFSLYLLTLALTLAFLPVSELLGLPWAQGIDVRDPISIIVSIATLHRTYYLVDVMLLYSVLFLLTPLAFLLIDQGKRWWVLGASWLLWGIFQVWPDFATLPWPIAGNYLFSFSAWQVIFFTGLVFGYGRKALPVPKKRTAIILLAVTGVLLAAMIALFFLVEPPTSAAPQQLATTSSAGHDLRAFVENFFLDKVDERPGRLFAAAVTFGFLFLAATLFWRPVSRALGWLLMPLGQHALYAYTVHVILVALVALAFIPLKVANPGPQWLNGLVQAASVGLIWAFVRFKVLVPTHATQRFYNYSPILLALLAGVALYLDPSPTYPGLTEPAAASAPAVSRFGTPLPPSAGAAAAAAAAPVPAAQPAADAGPAPEPTPTPEPKPLDPSLALARVAPYVGAINGTLEEHWFHSGILDRDMPFWAYLPPDYATAGRRYSVIYLLHGLGGHRDEWIAYGSVEVADREMSHGTMNPMIVIMPQGDKSYWVNHIGAGPQWGDYLTQDVVAEVDSTYRTLRDSKSRAVGGLSMGGFGSLSLAFSQPTVFGVVCADSPSLRVAESDIVFLGSGAEFAKRDPLVLAGALTGQEGLRIWIDTDEEDPWLDRAAELHQVLLAHNIEHTWHVFPGSHQYDYWSAHMIDYLHFYDSALSGL